MHRQKILIATALASSLIVPGLASAGLILDTGTPTGSVTSQLLNSDYAGEFAYSAGETITSVSAYVTAGSVQPGTNFIFALYANSGSFLTSQARNLPGPVKTATATFETNGWTTVSGLNWSFTTTGNYWLVVEPSGTPQGLDLPQEVNASTGTVPALAFADRSTAANAVFTEANAPPIGLEVTAVPLPAALPLLLSGLGGLGAFARRRTATRRSSIRRS